MARISLRLQAWGWLTRRQVSVATMSDAEIIAVQSRKIPENPVTRWLFGAAPPGIEIADRSVPAAGARIAVRVYRPAGAAPASGRPLVVYFHGGGFVFGTLPMGDWICGTVADQVGAVVVSVDYRLAPTHRFPVAVEDCYAALAWAAANRDELGAAGPIGVMGESAGGGLSAVMCLVARERGGPAIAHQALIYPVTDMTVDRSGSGDLPFLSAAEMAAYKRLYLGPDGDEADPWASPQLAPDHAGLPPALIQVAEHDPLRSDGLRYAAALREAGVPVRFTEYVGVPHGFVNFPGLSPAARQAMSEIVAAQRVALTPAEPAAPAQADVGGDT